MIVLRWIALHLHVLFSLREGPHRPHVEHWDDDEADVYCDCGEVF